MRPLMLAAAIATAALLPVVSCAAHEPAGHVAKAASPPESSGPVLEYVGGTALRAKDPKALSAWYSERFGLPIKGEMPGGFYGGFEWNDTSFNIAIVDADGEHPGSAPGTAYLVFHVSDYDGFIAARAAQGLTPDSTTSDPMGRFATFHDPEGNEVSVWGR